MTNDAAVAWVVVGTTEEYGDVILAEYAGTMDDIRKRVMDKAHREGFRGHFVERMASLGWRVEPLALATTVAELRAEVERLQALSAAISRDCNDCANQRNEANAKAAAAERRVAELEGLLSDTVGTLRRMVNDEFADCEQIRLEHVVNRIEHKLTKETP